MQCIVVKSGEFENSYSLLYILLKSCLCEFMVGGLWKIVREAVISDGKVTVTALTFQWWGSNYIEGPLFLSFTW